MTQLQIPKSNSTEIQAISIEKNMIIVGANGAGKTRLGSKLEHINSPTKRISAQRYLQISEVIEKKDFETATQQLKSMYSKQNPIHPENDYQQVLISLFAEESRRNESAVNEIKDNGSLTREDLPRSIKESVIEVWNFIFPYRELRLENDRIRALNGSVDFSGVEMSDGEKVGLYLISQILLAEGGCIFIIDEPELHLHKSLMVRLWNKLEECRHDCKFIYITHDLDFAASKPSSKMIWIQNYENNQWQWNEVDQNEIIPENLFLEMLGSRKPILFIEGDKGSLDFQIYQMYYEKFTVIPCAFCDKVIEAVKGFKSHPSLHDKKIFGLIDRDFHCEERLESLKEDGIFSIKLNEIENIFLIPEIIEIVCGHLGHPEKVHEIVSEIKTIYGRDKDNVKFRSIKEQRHRYIGERFGGINTNEEYETFKSNILSELDNITGIDLPDKDSDIVEILKVYPNKGMVRQVQTKIDFQKNGYKDLVLTLLNYDKKESIKGVLLEYLPEIS